MLDAKAAFGLARSYLTGDPIYANHLSVQPILITSAREGGWIIACEYHKGGQQVSQQKERAALMIDGDGKVVGMAKL